MIFFKKIKSIFKKNEEKEEETFVQEEKKEGTLVVDLYQTEKEFVIQAPLGGVKKEELEISVDDKMIKIMGERIRKTKEKGEFLIKECHFGPFSREIFLPEKIIPEKIKAKLENGILEIRLPFLKEKKEDGIKIEIEEISDN
ncbi:MAG: Hsp20/alpha crystallin family protein [Minisyncoccales bacterium]